MFNVSTRADYGLILMLELSKKYQQGFVSLTDVAEDKKLSAGYLVQIIQPLVAAKLIESKEGRSGGYQLLRAPSKISVLDVLEILDGDLTMVKCLKHGKHNCARSAVCEIKKVWPYIIEDVKKVLRKKTLADLLKEVK
ncbi:MAG: Rrf2 family transcriptional regulator [bacterium]|nr:Rrf2 family transcriptional regulator [bacterium]